MKKADESKQSIIRKKAEAFLKEHSLDKNVKITEVDAIKLIHELEVHQIELEMINDELVKANALNEEIADKYIELYDFSPISYFSINKNSEIIQLNFTGAKMLGRDRSKLLNNNFVFFVSEQTRTIFNQFLENIFSSGLKQTCEIEISDNSNIPTHLFLTGIAAAEGDYCLVTAIDITERKNLNILLLKMRKAINAASQVVFITDKEGIITFINPEFTKMYGYEADEVIGKITPRILKSGLLINEFYTEFWNTLLLKKNVESYDIINKRKDGSFVDVAITASPIVDDLGSIIGFIGMHKDITERKIAEKELLIAKEQAEESNRLKSAFLANMSHEIRTPMSGILGFSELLKNPELTPEKQDKYIEIIEKSGKRLLTTINDIIDISKIESGLVTVSISEVNISNQLEELFLFFNLEATSKGISLLFNNNLKNEQVLLKTDAVKLNGILTNLVKNAIKFTKEGSVEIGCTLNNVNIEFTIKDTGIGIPKSRQPFIFDRFVQADIEDKDAYQGSGLGLTIVKAYVELLGGKIWLESEEGKGSVFYVSLPINNPLENVKGLKNKSTEVTTTMPVKNLKILIVDDDEITQLYLTEVLDELTKDILIASDGARAIEQVKNNPTIDVILMDIKLPDMDGYEVTKQIRAFNKEVIIIAQTAYAMSDDKAKALFAGCNDYISKPISKDDLLEKIKATVTLKK